MFVYLTSRVLDDGALDIHEQEVGHKVFGRPLDYDTSVDNTVRVHASNLRKRLEQYFSEEGADEQLVIELPKGNYAPVFRPRSAVHEIPDIVIERNPPFHTISRQRDWRIPALLALVVLLAASTLVLAFRLGTRQSDPVLARKPIVRQFWSQVFPGGKATDVILDDASIASWQELTGRSIPLSAYYDRDYLRDLNSRRSMGSAPGLADALVLRRYTSFASANILWRLSELSSRLLNAGSVHFARDYSFRALKANNQVLLGNSRSDPWIEAFEPKLGFSWSFDAGGGGAYYPIDRLAGPSAAERYKNEGEHRNSPKIYATVALVANAGGTGSVLILSGTGGSAINAAGDFLTDEASMAQLRSRLPANSNGRFPYFEALLKITPRSRQPKDTVIEVCRPVR